jgi:uncharacterized protein (TIGR03435 family)
MVYSAAAQAPQDAPSLPSFEVATIRQTPPGNQENGFWTPPGVGLFTAHSVSLAFLIQIAFGVDGNQISGSPKWLDSDLFDVAAKPENGILLSREELRPRLQNLLQQRFHLATHFDTKMVRGYALVAAQGGPKLKATAGDRLPGFRIYVGPGRLEGINWSMPYLAAMLQKPAGLPVADKTGIAGSYDIKLEFAPDIETDSPLPSLFTALRERLGLELKAQKVSVQILVIDHLDRVPTDN